MCGCKLLKDLNETFGKYYQVKLWSNFVHFSLSWNVISCLSICMWTPCSIAETDMGTNRELAMRHSVTQ